MRRSDIAYVPNPKNYYPPVDYKKMSLEELKKTYLANCAKAHGDVSICSKCQNPCEHGKRAVQLVANEIYNDPPIPLYGGKTLIERAKEENRLRREKEAQKTEAPEVKKEEKPEKKKRGKYLRGDEWWKASIEYGDQVAYLVNELGYSKTKAKATIYSYRSRHGLVGTPVVAEKPKETVESEPVMEQNAPKNDIILATMEQKLAELMKLQDEYKKQAEKYTKLYNEAKEQSDVLCRAIEMFS